MFHITVYLLVATEDKTISIPTALDKTDGKFRHPPPTKSRTENGVFCPSRGYLLHLRGDGGFQGAKKVVSDSTGLVDFAIRQVNSLLKLPDWLVKLFMEFKSRRNCHQSCSLKWYFGLV